jgi:hypothetical protein
MLLVDNSVTKTMTDVQMMRQFTNSHPSVTQYHGMDSFSVLLCSECGRGFDHFSSASVFEHGYPLVHTLFL